MTSQGRSICPKCGHYSTFVKNGYVILKRLPKNDNRFPKYLCKKCGKSFYVVTEIKQRKEYADNTIKRFALHLYIAGLTPKAIIELLVKKGFHNAKPIVGNMEKEFMLLDKCDFITRENTDIGQDYTYESYVNSNTVPDGHLMIIEETPKGVFLNVHNSESRNRFIREIKFHVVPIEGR